MATAFAARGWQGWPARAVLRPVAVAVLPGPAEESPQKAPNAYFLVDIRRPFRHGIRNAGNMAVFCNLPPGQTVIELYTVGAEERWRRRA